VVSVRIGSGEIWRDEHFNLISANLTLEGGVDRDCVRGLAREECRQSSDCIGSALESHKVRMRECAKA
jgi:hypothetical protein